jgi:DNA-binding beta-propeller fold protein YncE
MPRMTFRRMRDGLIHVACAVLLVGTLVGCGERGTPTASVPTQPRPTIPYQPLPSATPTATPRVAPTPMPTLPAPVFTVPLPTIMPTPTPPDRPVLFATVTLSQLPGAGHAPSAIALLGEQAYVCNRSSNNVSILAQGQVKAVVPVGNQPNALVASPALGRVFVLNLLDSSISVIEGERVVATWPVGEPCTSLALVEGELWVGLIQGGRIVILSPQDGRRLGEVALSQKSNVLNIVAGAQGRAYVATYGRTQIVDAPLRREVASISLNTSLALSASLKEGSVYVTEYDAQAQQNYLVALDMNHLAEKARAPLAADIQGVLADPQRDRIYALSSYTHQLLMLDSNDYRTVGQLAVGRGPRALALDQSSGLLYIANATSDNITIVDTRTDTIKQTIALSMQIADVHAPPLGNRVYLASPSSNAILTVDEGGSLERWLEVSHPTQVSMVASRGAIAVLSSLEARLWLYDLAGRLLLTHETGRDPHGLLVDDFQQRIYAGDLVLDLMSGMTHTLRIPTLYEGDAAPVQVVQDTRRGTLYAVAFNGIPGSNGGNVVTRLSEDGSPSAAHGLGRLSVIDLLYDEQMDHFYATHVRMGNYGLSVSEAETEREILYIPLSGYPAKMALNPATQHLWVLLQPSGSAADSRIGATVLAFDARTLGQVAEIKLEGRADVLAVDPGSSRVYVAGGGLGAFYMIQDVAMPAPASRIPTHTPAVR